jgi:hypothetical protein
MKKEIALILLLAAVSFAAVTESWNRTWGSGGGFDDKAFGVVADSNNNAYVTGKSISLSVPSTQRISLGLSAGEGSGNVLALSSQYGIITKKYDSNGNPGWTQYYNRADTRYDSGKGIAMSADNYLYVAGFSYYSAPNSAVQRRLSGLSSGYSESQDSTLSFGGGGGNPFDSILLKYDLNGNLQTGFPVINTEAQEDAGNAVAISPSGYIYVAGYKGVAGAYDGLLLKYNSAGALQGSAITWNSGADEKWNGVAVDSSNNVYVVGYSNAGAGHGNYDIVVSKYDSSGNLVSGWPKYFGGTGIDYGYGIAVSGSYIYIVGEYYNGANQDAVICKLDLDGNIQADWPKLYGGSNYDAANGVSVDASGNVFMTGTTVGTDYQVFTQKYGSDGTLLWTQLHGDTNNDLGYGVGLGSSQVFYVSGSTNRTDSYFDGLLIKYSEAPPDITAPNVSTVVPASATKNVRKQFNITASDDTGVTSCTLYWNGGSVSGMILTSGTSASGTWAANYTPPSTGDASAWANCTDLAGNTAKNSTTVSVSGAAGPTLGWSRTTGTNLIGTSVATDSENTAYVAGYSGLLTSEQQRRPLGFSSSGSSGKALGLSGGGCVAATPLYLAKYNSSGDKQWDRSFGACQGETLNAIATDASDNIYAVGTKIVVAAPSQQQRRPLDLGGSSPSSQGSVLSMVGYVYEFALYKYDSNGNSLGLIPYDTPAANDIAYGVATSSDGYVYVVGSSNNRAVLLKYSSDLVLQEGFPVYFDEGGDDAWYAVTVGSDGYLYLTGTTSSPDGNSGGYDFLIGKYSSAGAVQWTVKRGTASNDVGRGIAVAGDYVYVVGDMAGTYSAIWKLNRADGSAVNSAYYDGGTTDVAYGVVADSSNNLYVVGYAAIGTLRPVLLKYDTGLNFVWSEIHYIYGRGFGVAMDSNSKIYLGGDTGTNSPLLLNQYSDDTTAPSVFSVTPVTAEKDVATEYYADASDASGVTGCTFYWDGVSQGAMANTGGNTWAKNYTSASSGSHYAWANCTDAAGNTNKENTTITVSAPDTTAPTVSGVTPASVGKGPSTKFAVDATDDVAVTGCTFYWDGDSIGEMPEVGRGTWARNYAPDAEGNFTAWANCTDAAGNTARTETVIQVKPFSNNFSEDFDGSADPDDYTGDWGGNESQYGDYDWNRAVRIWVPPFTTGWIMLNLSAPSGTFIVLKYDGATTYQLAEGAYGEAGKYYYAGGRIYVNVTPGDPGFAAVPYPHVVGYAAPESPLAIVLIFGMAVLICTALMALRR